MAASAAAPDDAATTIRGSDYYNPRWHGRARCWGSTALGGGGNASAARRYWWTFRGVHVDPAAPFTNEELASLRDAMLGGNLTGRAATSAVVDARSAASAPLAPGASDPSSSEPRASSSSSTQPLDDDLGDSASESSSFYSQLDWEILRVPPAPTSHSETADALIEAKSADQGEETIAGLAIAVLLIVLGSVVLIGAWLRRREIRWLHRAGAGLLVGVLGGCVMIVASARSTRGAEWVLSYGDYLVFDTEFFFLFLLPPVIFESGYALDAEPFFRNLGTISVFAFGGTIVGAGAFGLVMWGLGQLGVSHAFTFLNAMTFGAIVSATDPVTVLAVFGDLRVDRDLFAVVFGESVLNDAVAVVMYRATYQPGGVLASAWAFVVVFVGSTLIGVGIALASALFFKHVALAEGGTSRSRGGASNVLVREKSSSKSSVEREKGVEKRHGGAESAVKSAVTEAAVVALFPWIAYMLAEAPSSSASSPSCSAGSSWGGTPGGTYPRAGARSPPARSRLAQLSETFVFVYVPTRARRGNRPAPPSGRDAACLLSRRGFVLNLARREDALVQRLTRRDGFRARARGGVAAGRRRQGDAHRDDGRGGVHRVGDRGPDDDGASALRHPERRHPRAPRGERERRVRRPGFRSRRGGFDGEDGMNPGDRDPRAPDEVAVLIRSERRTARR